MQRVFPPLPGIIGWPHRVGKSFFPLPRLGNGALNLSHRCACRLLFVLVPIFSPLGNPRRVVHFE